MTKQFNLLATDVDLREIEHALATINTVELLSDRATDDLASLMPLDGLAIPPDRAGSISLFCYLIPRHLPRRLYIERESPIKIHLDEQRSHVIEFWRPYYNGKILRPGRVYYQNRLGKGGSASTKDDRFCSWADNVMAVIRKQLKRDPKRVAYVGKDADAAISAGTILVKSVV